MAYCVAVVVATSKDAGICRVAQQAGIPLAVLEPQGTDRPLARALEQIVRDHEIDVLVLAGFMQLLPTETISLLHGRVLNIHPALLPEFGGQGMYGIRVHKAVLASGVAQTGATVHVVNEEYDKGSILAQARIDIIPGESPEDLQARVRAIEHSLYPATLDQYARLLLRANDNGPKVNGNGAFS